MQTEFSNFRRRDYKGRRVSIFGKYNSEKKEIAITVITCSKMDVYIKKIANKLYNSFSSGGTEACKPEQFLITDVNSNPKWNFLNWCRENYYVIVSENFRTKGVFLQITNDRKMKSSVGRFYTIKTLQKV